MARLWQSGAELNSTTTDVEFSNVTGTGTSISSTTVLDGTYSIRTNPSAATNFFRFHVYTSNQSAVAYQRAWLRIATAPGANTTVMRFVDTANNPCAQIRLTSSSTLVLLDAGGNTVGSASSALSANTWYCVELGLDASSSPGSVTARLNEVQFATGNNSVQSPWARVLVGPVVSATCDLFWDSWAVNDSTGGNQNSWPGASRVIHLTPNADGDNHAWSDTANSAGTSNNYTLVDDIPPNDTTDYVQTGTANNEDMYNLSASGIGSNDVVNVVMVGARLRNNTADATTAAKVQIKKTSGGTIAQGSAIVPNTTTFFTNANAQPRNYTYIAYADPDGSAWTQSTLDTAQAGVKLTTAGTNRIQVTSVWVSVDYTPTTLVTPSAVAAVASVPAPTVDTGSANATPTPSAVASAATLPAPTVLASSTLLPSAVASVATLPAPTVSTSWIVTPGAVASLAATPAPTLSAGATPTPNAVACSAATPAPGVNTDWVVTPGAVACSASTPAITFYADAIPAPGAVAGVASLPAPTLSAGATVTVSVVAVTASAPAPTLSTGSTPTPSAVTATASAPSPSVFTDWTATPDVVACVASVPAPAIQVGGSVTVLPSAVAGTASVPAATISAGSTVTPSVAALTASAPLPALSAGAAPTPNAVAGAAALAAVALSTGATISTSVVPVTGAVASTTLSAGATATPNAVAGLVAVPAQSLQTGSALSLAVLAVAASVPAVSAGNLSALAQELATLVTVTGRLGGTLTKTGRLATSLTLSGRMSAEVD